MSTKPPITQLIDEWPSRKALAEQIGAEVSAVHKWALNGRIPAGWHKAVVDAARDRGFAYATPDWLIEQHDRKRAESAT